MGSNDLLSQLWKYIQDVIGPLGGLAAIIVGISAWIGKVWANRIVEGDRAKYAQVLEKQKVEYEREVELYRTQLEISKSIIGRYSEQQFEAYNQLWTSLYNLQVSGDALWEAASQVNLYNFSKQLRSTEEMVGRMSLFIEDEHFAKLNQIIIEFSEYQLGKKKLINLRNMKDINYFMIDEFMQIQNNRQRFQEYSRLASEIRDSFRRQINISLQPSSVEPVE